MQEKQEEDKSYNDFESQFPDLNRKARPVVPAATTALTGMEIESIAYTMLKEGAAKPKVVSELTAKGVERITAINAAEKYALIVEKEIDGATLKPSKMVFAVIGALAGAMTGGFIWGWIGMATGSIFSAIAIGIGVLSGIGALLGAKGARGPLMQLIAGISAIFGVLFGTYYIIFAIVNQYAADNGIAEGISFFSPKIINFFAENYSKLLGPYDYVFMLVAVITAWGIPKDMHSK